MAKKKATPRKKTAKSKSTTKKSTAKKSVEKEPVEPEVTESEGFGEGIFSEGDSKPTPPEDDLPEAIEEESEEETDEESQPKETEKATPPPLGAVAWDDSNQPDFDEDEFIDEVGYDEESGDYTDEEEEEEEEEEDRGPDHPACVQALQARDIRLDMNDKGCVWRAFFYQKHGDALLPHLHGLPSLKELWLLGSRVTKTGYEEMKRELPNVTIYY